VTIGGRDLMKFDDHKVSGCTAKARRRRLPSPDQRASYFVSRDDLFRKAKASGPHILIITTAQEAMPTKASMTVRAISMVRA